METLTQYEKHLKFVQTHLNFLTPSEIEGIFKTVYRKTFKDIAGIPIGKHDTVSFVPVKNVDKHDTHTTKPYYLNFDLHVYENVNIIEKHLNDNGVSFDEYKEFLLFSYLFTECYFSFNTEYSTVKPNSLRDLVQFLYWIETGVILNFDVIKESYGVVFGSSTLNISIGDLKIKRLQNGKIYIKGLVDGQIRKMKRFDELRRILPKHEY